MDPRRVVRRVRTLAHVHGLPSLASLIEKAQYLPVHRRKALLKLTRVQQSPARNRGLRSILGKSIIGFEVTPRVDGGFHTSDIAEIVDDTSRFLSSPVFCSLLSQFFRNAPPLHTVSEEQVIIESVTKELGAAISDYEHRTYDLSPIFSPLHSDRVKAIHPLIKPRYHLNNLFHIRLCNLRDRLRGHVFFPRYSSRKGTSRATKSYFLRNTGMTEEEAQRSSNIHVTTADILHLYSRTGVQTPGMSEMRYSWKMNDLASRTYYAMGGTEYFAGMYMQEFANMLVQEVSCTKVPDRFNLNRLQPITETDRVWLYDLTSFTSRLSVIKVLMRELALFFRGCTVVVIDVFGGPQQVDLGELIENHAEASYNMPEFDISGVTDSPGSYARHVSAGMLGVYGNIVFSTFVHGLVLSNVCGSDDACACVGDDAMAVTAEQEYPDFDPITCIRPLGILHPEKVWTWLMDSADTTSRGYVFLKRPVDRILGRLFSGLLFDFPNVPNILNEHIPDRTEQPSSNLHVRRKTFITQWCRLLSRIQVLVKPSEDELALIHNFGQAAYNELRLPIKGFVPGRSSTIHSQLDFLVPDIRVPELILTKWLDVLLNRDDRQAVFTLPAFRQDPAPPPSELFRTGNCFQCTGNKLVKLAETMRWVDVAYPEKETLLWSTDRELLRDFYERRLHKVYEVTVLQIPDWYHRLDSLYSAEPPEVNYSGIAFDNIRSTSPIDSDLDSQSSHSDDTYY